MEVIIDTRINMAAMFHDVLHGFFAGRGTWIVITELNLAQELSSVDQEPLLLVLLDLIKAYEKLYRGRLLKTLEGYGEGPKMWGILADLWAWKAVVTRQNGHPVHQFRATHGTTKGGMIYLTLYNVVEDNVVWNCLSMTVDDDNVICNRMGHAVVQIVGVLYKDDGLIVFQDTEWLQGSLNVLIGLFHRIGLMANVAKSKIITCHPGTIRSIMLEEVVGQRSTRKGATYQ